MGANVVQLSDVRQLRKGLTYPSLQSVLEITDMSKVQRVRPLPDHLYVDVLTVTKYTSTTILAFCLLSIVVFLVTGFSAIQPVLAALIDTAAVTFFLMDEIIRLSRHERI
jgi:hypothetical protein